MRVSFVGSHPLMSYISDHIVKTHIVVSPTRADLVFLGICDTTKVTIAPSAKVVLLSSYHVYGGYNHQDKINEDTPVSIHPLSDLSTIALSYLNNETAYVSNKKATILRIFPVLGTETFVDTLVLQSKNGQENRRKLRLGWRTRSFLYIEDFLDAIDKVIQTPIPGIYNLGSEEEVSIQEAANVIWQYSNNTTNQVEEEWLSLPWRPTKMVPSTERFRMTFNWEPKVSFKIGIKTILTS